MMEGSGTGSGAGSGAGSVLVTNGSGCGSRWPQKYGSRLVRQFSDYHLIVKSPWCPHHPAGHPWRWRCTCSRCWWRAAVRGSGWQPCPVCDGSGTTATTAARKGFFRQVWYWYFSPFLNQCGTVSGSCSVFKVTKFGVFKLKIYLK